MRWRIPGRGRALNLREVGAEWVVYTCVTGGYDRVLPPLQTTPNARFVLFSDRPETRVRGWETLPLQDLAQAEGPRINRAHKILGPRLFPDHRVSLYVDGNIRILSDLTPLFDAFAEADADIALPRHPQRETVAEEVEACIAMGKADEDVLRNEYAALLSEGFDPYARLTENNVIFRRQSPALDTAMDDWWRRVRDGTGRDQLSLPHVLSRHGLRIMDLSVNARVLNQWFRLYRHPGRFGSPWAWRRHVLKAHRGDDVLQRLKVLRSII